MNSILKKIVENKKKEITIRQKSLPLLKLKSKLSALQENRGFSKAVSVQGKINIIAEIKKASPSLGLIKTDFDYKKIAKEYKAGGASAISVLTEEKYFKGHINYLNEIRNTVSLPLLRKDFIFEPYQVYESKAFGADAVLFIAALVDGKKLCELINIANTLKLDPLVEVHDVSDLEKIKDCKEEYILGINNRNLNDFKVDKETAKRLMPFIPKGRTIVVESGIQNFDDVKMYRELGINTFLIGESLMRAENIGKKLKELTGAA
jgi:indole-3-glycerol phosphate synthase